MNDLGNVHENRVVMNQLTSYEINFLIKVFNHIFAIIAKRMVAIQLITQPFLQLIDIKLGQGAIN